MTKRERVVEFVKKQMGIDLLAAENDFYPLEERKRKRYINAHLTWNQQARLKELAKKYPGYIKDVLDNGGFGYCVIFARENRTFKTYRVYGMIIVSKDSDRRKDYDRKNR